MAESRGRAEWAQTAEILCVLHNANRDMKKHPKPFDVARFNPFARKHSGGVRVTKENIGEMKDAFLKGVKQ